MSARGQAWLRRASIILGAIVATLAITVFAGWYWYTHRSAPEPGMWQLFHGVEYRREVRTDPRPLIIHRLDVDLAASGLSVVVTPGRAGDELPLAAMTTSEFADAHSVQVAINGDGFDPWYSQWPWDYYPESGEPVEPLGFASADGTVYSKRTKPGRTTLSFGADGRAFVGRGHEGVEIVHALSGLQRLVRAGKLGLGKRQRANRALHPRSAVAINRGGDRLTLVVIDGRQPGYSEGVTLEELAELMIEYGADEAINLDGGGSTTLVIDDGDDFTVVNSPIHTRIPGRERPVGNHLGIRARPLPEAPWDEVL